MRHKDLQNKLSEGINDMLTHSQNIFSPPKTCTDKEKQAFHRCYQTTNRVEYIYEYRYLKPSAELQKHVK